MIVMSFVENCSLRHHLDKRFKLLEKLTILKDK